MQQLLTGEKIIQTQRDAPQNHRIPNWPELSVRNVYPVATRLPGVLERLPDEWTGNLRTDKNFFWCTVRAQHPRWVMALVNDCTA